MSFSAFLGASPDTASAEDLRRYRLHLVAIGTGVPTMNHTLTALRFLYMVTPRKPAVVAGMPFVQEPRRLPIVLRAEDMEHAPPGQGRVNWNFPPIRGGDCWRSAQCFHGISVQRRKPAK
jgi:hypothetical protein